MNQTLFWVDKIISFKDGIENKIEFGISSSNPLISIYVTTILTLVHVSYNYSYFLFSIFKVIYNMFNIHIINYIF